MNLLKLNCTGMLIVNNAIPPLKLKPKFTTWLQVNVPTNLQASLFMGKKILISLIFFLWYNNNLFNNLPIIQLCIFRVCIIQLTN